MWLRKVSPGWVLLALYLLLTLTAPLNRMLEPRFVFLGFLIVVLLLGIATTLYGVNRAWPAELETLLPGTGEADRKRREELEEHGPDSG